MPDVFSRRLSPLERVWLLADRLLPPFVNQLVLEGEGRLDPARLAAASARAAAANPGSRLVLRGRVGWSRWVDAGLSPPVRAVDGRAWSGSDGDGAPFLAAALPPRSGPTCELLVVSGAPPRLVLRTHHAVMDGRGTLLFAEDLFRALRGEEPLGARARTTDIELARRTRRPWRGRLLRPLPETCIAPTGGPRGAPRGVRWRRVRIAARASLLLPRLAIAVAAAARRHADGRVLVHVPVDMRPRLPDARSTANLCGLIELEVPAAAEPEALARLLRERVERGDEAELVSSLWPLALVPMKSLARRARRGLARMHARGRYSITASLSNLGALALDRLQGAGFRARTAFFIPPGAENIPLFAAATGVGDALELTATMPVALASDQRLEGLLAELADALAREPLSPANGFR